MHKQSRFRFLIPLPFLLIQIASLTVAAQVIEPSRASADWNEVKALADAGKLGEALQLLRARPAENAHYFYNVGTLYYRVGRMGTAVAFLEKANRMQPHDTDIRHNLSRARADLARTLGEDKLDPASSWTEKLADHFSLNEVRGTLGLFALILILFWIRRYVKTRRLASTFLQPAGILGFLGFAIAATLYGAHQLAAKCPPAVGLDRQVIRSGPGDHFLELGHLEAGVKVRMTGPSQNVASPSGQGETWNQIRFTPQQVGWVRAANLLVL